MSQVENYRKWAHALVYAWVGPGHPDHDDLVNEALIAIWKAEQTHDPAKGSLPAWVTKAAEMRMRDLAWGHGQWTGHAAMRGRKAVQEMAWDDLSQPAQEAYEPRARDFAEEAAQAYHHGQIQRIIAQFTPGQQSAIRAVLAGGALTAVQRAALSAVRGRLRAELESLVENSFEIPETKPLAATSKGV